jgi:hypothetical protein
VADVTSFTVQVESSGVNISHLLQSVDWLYHLFTKSNFEDCRLLGCDAVSLFVKTDISEERTATIIGVTRIGELGKALVVAVNVVPSSLIYFTLKLEATRSSETFGLTRAILYHIPEVAFFIVTAVTTSNVT